MSNLASIQKLSSWNSHRAEFDSQYNDPYYLSQNLGQNRSFDSERNSNMSRTTSSVSNDYYFQPNDIVANAFSSATNLNDNVFTFPDYDPLADPFDSDSPRRNSSPSKLCEVITSPISPNSAKNSSAYSSNYTDSSPYYTEIGNESHCIHSDYQLQHPITYEVHTSSETLRQGDLDIDSDDLLNIDNDPGFYDLIDDIGEDLFAVQQRYTLFETPKENRKHRDKVNSSSKCLQQHKKRSAANQRERKRMQVINDGFEKLRRHLPYVAFEKKLSKVDTLKSAIDYISFMTKLLKAGTEGDNQQPKKKIIVYHKNKEKNSDDDGPENDVIGHSLSWSWEENELSWAPTTINEENNASEALNDSEIDNNELSSELSYPKVSKPKRKRVCAKIWRPKFPGEKPMDENQPNKDEINKACEEKFQNAVSMLNDKASFFQDIENVNQTTALSPLRLPHENYMSEDSVVTNENFEDFPHFQDYSLPPVSSLFEPSTATEPCQTSAAIRENNYLMNDIITSEQNNDYSFQTTLDTFLWTPKELLSQTTQTATPATTCCNLSLSVK